MQSEDREDGSSDDDAICLAALEMAEQQQREGQSRPSCGPDSAQDAQHQHRGGKTANVPVAAVTDVENKLPDADSKGVQTLEHELAEGGKINDALVAKVAMLEAAIANVQGERDAEKEKVRLGRSRET